MALAKRKPWYRFEVRLFDLRLFIIQKIIETLMWQNIDERDDISEDVINGLGEAHWSISEYFRKRMIEK